MLVSRYGQHLVRGRRYRWETTRQSFGKRQHVTESQPPPRNNNFDLPIAFCIGGTAGMLGSLAGMGGGFVMIPMMTSSLLRLTQHQAHGTSLAAVMSTGLAGALGYASQVQLDVAAAIAVTGMLTARLGAHTTSIMSGRALKRALGVLMLLMAPAVPLKAHILQQQKEKLEDNNNTSSFATATTKTHLISGACIGLFSGYLAGLFGVGGGTIVVPALAVATDMTHYQALATSLAAMTLPAAMGTYTHFQAGNVVVRIAPPLIAGAFIGGYAGGKLGLRTKESTLQWGFFALLATLGVRTLLKA